MTSTSDGDFDEGVRLRPEDADATHKRGYAKVQIERMECGVADFDEALRLRPDDAAACYNGGNAMARVGRNDGAVDDLRTGLELA